MAVDVGILPTPAYRTGEIYVIWFVSHGSGLKNAADQYHNQYKIQRQKAKGKRHRAELCKKESSSGQSVQDSAPDGLHINYPLPVKVLDVNTYTARHARELPPDYRPAL